MYGGALCRFCVLLLPGTEIPPKRVERSTVKRLALFKDHHGAMGVPAGCGVGKIWVFTRRFTPVVELIFTVDYGGLLVIENQGES